VKVIPIAATQIIRPAHKESGYPGAVDFNVTDADELAEIGGRVCYQSWNRPNPKTATNAGYLDNILTQGHYSVLEHSSVTFYVEGVSRSLLTELERHRFLSFSVVSQRYVRVSDSEFVAPPAIDEYENVRTRNGMTVSEMFGTSVGGSHYVYEEISNALIAEGVPRKRALEAARSVLPNATEVKMLVTGNIRCWRDVIGKRYHEAADAEIREFATEVLGHLREIAPNSVQDIPAVPYA
jgi:thymidylate synthase (FAD)